jgi:osmotically-inducible protein OsmY
MCSAAGFVIPLKEKFVGRKEHKAGKREIKQNATVTDNVRTGRGELTLKRRVESDAEKKSVESTAADVAGLGSVENQRTD